MSTTKTRINISLPDDVKEALFRLAKKEHMPAATKAERLLEIALELEEDQAWDRLAGWRDDKNARFIPHEQAFDI